MPTSLQTKSLKNFIYQAPTYLKSHGKFHEDISIAKCHSNEEMCRFSDILEILGENQSATENVILDGKETSGSINDIETKYTSVEDVINKRKTASNEATVSEIPNTIDDENIIIAKR